MAANKISSVIDPALNQDILDTVKNLATLKSQFLDTLEGAVQLRNATANSQNFKEYTANADQVNLALQKINKATADAQLAEEKLAAFRLKQQQAEEARIQKEAQAAEKRLQILQKQQAAEEAANQKQLAAIQREAQAAEEAYNKKAAAAQRAAAIEAQAAANAAKGNNSNGLYETGPDTPAAVPINSNQAQRSEEEIAALQAKEAAFQEYAAAQTTATAATAENAAATQTETSALIENLTILNELKVQLALVNAEIKEKGVFDAELTAEQLRLSQAVREQNSLVGQLVKEEVAASGSTNELRAQLETLRIEYNNLTKEEKANVDVGVKKLAQIQELDKALKTEMGSIGKFQDNVGDYPAIDKAIDRFTSLDKIGARVINSLGRQLIGMATGFLSFAVGAKALELVGNYLVELADKYRIFALVSKEAEQEAKNVNNAIASADYQKAVQNVNELTENIKLAKEGFLKKDDVLKEYNDTIGKTTGQVKTLGEAEQALIKNAANYIEMTRLKAVAQMALKDATEAQYKIAQIEAKTDADAAGYLISGVVRQLDYLKEQQALAIKNGASKAVLDGYKTSIAASEKIVKDAARNNREEQEKDLKEQAGTALKIFDDYQTKAAELAKKSGFNFFDPTKNKKGGSDNSDVDALRKQAELAKKEAENDKNSYDERYKEAKIYYDKLNELADLQAKKDKAAGKNPKSVDKATTAQKGLNADAYSEEVIKIQKDFLQKQYEIQKAAYDALLSAADEYNRQELKKVASNYADQERILSEQYKSGALNAEEYQLKKKELSESYNNVVTQQEIDALQDRIDVETAFGADTLADQKKLDDLLIKQNHDKNAKIIADNEAAGKKREEIAKKNAQAEKKAEETILKDVAQVAINIVKGRYAQEEQAIKDKQEAIDTAAQAEIDAENRSLDSSQVKADKIAIINAKAAAQKAILANQEKKIKHDEAVFDKRINEAKIIANTAVAISEANPNPFLMILAAAVGAAELAVVISEPVPAFKKGGTVKKDGIVLTGEEGTEIEVSPSGRVSLTPDVPNLSYKKAGTKFISHAETMRIMARPEPVQYVGGEAIDFTEVKQQLGIIAKNTARPYPTPPPAPLPDPFSWRNSEYLNRNIN